MLQTAALFVVLVLLLLAFWPGAASAHVRSTTGFSEIRQDGAEVRYELSVEYKLLAAAVGLGQSALDAPSDDARAAALDESRGRVAAYLESSIRVSLDGVECPGELERTRLERRQDIVYAVAVLSYECPGSASGSYEVAYGVFTDSDAVVDEHTNVADYVLGGERGRFIFDSGHRELTLGQTSPLSSARRFVVLGVEHILSGLDHVLFIVALLLGAHSLKSLLKVATTFTAAHSLTLGLASLGWVEVPPEIVEPLIALSIGYVAVDNILGRGPERDESRHRLPIVFGFGLMHGLAFADTLSFTDDVSWRVLSSLLMFNVGIEVGQALIFVPLFALLLFLRRYSWSRIVHVGATGVIAVFGFFWFFERLPA